MIFSSFPIIKKGLLIAGLLFLSLFLINWVFVGKVTLEVDNLHKDKSYHVVNEIVPYAQEIIYTDRIPSGESRVALEGKDGIYTYDSIGNQIVLQELVNAKVEVGTGALGDYIGKLTGYGADCVGCSRLGNVACRTQSGAKHSLIKDGIYYQDSEYGNVRIVSAASDAFPCGTIISVDNGRQEPFYVVVLDRGGSMNTAWKNGVVWIDLAFASQVDAKNGNISSKNASFHVKRWGW